MTSNDSHDSDPRARPGARDPGHPLRQRPSDGHGDVMPPIHLSTTFDRAADGSYPGGYEYVRDGNPNRDDLEACLAALEGGSDAAALPSGMAATHAVFSALEPGDRVVVPEDAYFGTGVVLREHFRAGASKSRPST